MIAPETIVTQRLRGSRVRPDDLPHIISIDTDPEVQKTLFGIIHTEDQSRERLARWLKLWDDHGFGFWIFRDSMRNDVGHAGLFHSPGDHDNVEVGYAIKPVYWNNGYATEMTLGVLAAGFEVLSLPRIVAITQPANAASRRVMEKSGLTYDREILFRDGTPRVRYSIDREAWLRLHYSDTTSDA
ncbi:MAG: GNAT family N-acetyltransferase [Vulcanimicrobiaceae bacterium]